jgi:polyhydroxyalkanoate synthesis regulator phasin
MGLISDITNLFSGGQQQNAQNTLGSSINQINSITQPTAAQMQVILQQEVNSGNMTPEQATAIMQQPNAYSSVLQQMNPANLQAANNALSQLQQVGQSGGITPQMAAQEQAIQTNNNTNLAGNIGQIQQQAQQRGLGGSGANLASALTAAQGAATDANTVGLGIAAQGQTNALNALTSAGNLGANLNQQQFSQLGTVANAQNAINNFNATNQQNTANTNTANANAAQSYNLMNQQAINNANTGIANTQTAYNAQLPEQVYNNQLNQAKTAAGASTALGQTQNQQATNNTNTLGNTLTGIGSYFNNGTNPFGTSTSGNNSTQSDETLKENKEEFSPSDFLDHITGYKYNYKPGTGLPQKPHVGIMAQDLEKAPGTPPGAVGENHLGKTIDYNKMGGPMFASLANIHQRVKKLEGKE